MTADPGQLVKRSPLDAFAMPESFSDVGVILGYALVNIRVIIADYKAFLDRVRGKDDLSYQLVVGLLGGEVHREAEIVAALRRGD